MSWDHLGGLRKGIRLGKAQTKAQSLVASGMLRKQYCACVCGGGTQGIWVVEGGGGAGRRGGIHPGRGVLQ